MFVIPKMQINKFESRPVLSNRQMFLMSGSKPATFESKDTADCANEALPIGARKTQLLGLAQEIAQKAVEMKNSNGSAEPLEPTNPREK